MTGETRGRTKQYDGGVLVSGVVVMVLAAIIALSVSLGVPAYQAHVAANTAALPVVVEIVQMKDGSTFAGEVVAGNAATLNLRHTVALSVVQPAKDAVAPDDKPKMQMMALSQSEIKTTGEIALARDSVLLTQPLTADSPIYKAVTDQK